MRATPARFSSAASSGRRKPGSTALANPSIPATTITSAATPSSTALSSCGIAPRISRPSPIATAQRRVGRSVTTSWSPGIRAPRRSTTFAARWVRPHRAPSFGAVSVWARARRAGDREVRERMKRVGLSPFPLPLGVDIEKWLARGKTPWDAFPDTGAGKMDAESCALSKALAHGNVELCENARVERLILSPDGKRVTGVEASIAGERQTISARIVIVAAGAVNSAALLLGSREGGVANRSDAVGRRFMNHNCSALLAIDPRSVNNSLPEDDRNQRLLPRRRSRRAAAWQHPTARPRHRADPQIQCTPGAGMGVEPD